MLRFFRDQAEWARLVLVFASSSVVLAENHPRNVFGDILRTNMGVERHVYLALEVVRVLVKAHGC